MNNNFGKCVYYLQVWLYVTVKNGDAGGGRPVGVDGGQEEVAGVAVERRRPDDELAVVGKEALDVTREVGGQGLWVSGDLDGVVGEVLLAGRLNGEGLGNVRMQRTWT